MLKKFANLSTWNRVIFCLVPLVIMPSQHDTKTGKQTELMTLQMKVTDTKTGSAIDNAEVVIKWAEGQKSHSVSATTNSIGLARFNDLPRGKVEIRVMAKGYKVHAPPPIDLPKEDQPIKIELTKQTFSEEHAKDIPAR